MVPYTIVLSDVGRHDVGVRGTSAFWAMATRFGGYAELALYWLLKEYFGVSAVQLMTPSQLLRSSPESTDVLFVAVPTRVHKQHLSRIRYRRLVLYDSSDVDGIRFNYSDRDFLLSETNLCLKNWRDSNWKLGVDIGLLPIKWRPWNKLRMALWRQSVMRRFRQLPTKSFDVGFVARPTGDFTRNQRVAWLVDLKRRRPDLKLWGGLVGGKKWRKIAAQSHDSDIFASLWIKRKKVTFLEYFRGLCQSKVALAPCGFAPWSYRHYEAIYARSLVVSNDLSDIELLIPLPPDGIVQVRDNESVVPAVERALALYDESPEILESNVEYIERWFDRGTYSRRRHDLIDRFLVSATGSLNRHLRSAVCTCFAPRPHVIVTSFKIERCRRAPGFAVAITADHHAKSFPVVLRQIQRDACRRRSAHAWPTRATSRHVLPLPVLCCRCTETVASAIRSQAPCSCHVTRVAAPGSLTVTGLMKQRFFTWMRCRGQFPQLRLLEAALQVVPLVAAAVVVDGQTARRTRNRGRGGETAREPTLKTIRLSSRCPEAARVM